MKTQVYGLDGNAVREIELSDTVFGRDVSEGSIYHAIRNELGNKRSPVWVGGGKIFGPRQRDYSYVLPRKVKRLALISLLSLKAKEDKLRVVTDFTVASGKTKDLVTMLSNLAARERTVVILKDDDALMKRAGRNVPGLSYLSFNRDQDHDL